MSHFITLIVLLCLSHLSTQRSTPEDDHYVAAVVEYRVTNDVPANLQNYVNLIKDASGQNADIIVFPELTLSRGRSVVIPIHGILEDNPVPALRPDLYDEVLVTISSAARQNAIYVVINIEELVDCTKETSEYCPKEEVYLFNTNVVFDRTGAVIDRYRKINLFGEYTRTPALQPDLGVFTTDFGVTFGHFICFDLMFQVPAVQLVDKHNLTDIIFPTMWFSEMPYLTAVQIQEAYAYSMNLNFLGAGANNVNVGSAGSGIYSGKAGALVSIMPGVPTTRLLVAKVPKIPGQVRGTYPGPIYDDPNDQDNLTLIADPSLPSHISKLLTPGFQEITLTDKDVTCHFKVRLNQRNSETSYYYRAFIQDSSTTYSRRPIGVAACLIVTCKTDDIKSCPYRYRVAAFSGVRSFSGVATGGTRVCSVIACTNNSIESCGRRFPNYIQNTSGIFEELEITAEVPTPVIDADIETSNSAYFPVSVDTAIMPLESNDYTFEEVNANGRYIYNFKLNNFDSELYAFAIWGRVFGTDGQEASPPVEENDNIDEIEPTPFPPENPQTDAAVVHSIKSILLFISIYVILNV